MREELLEKIKKQFDVHIYNFIEDGLIDLRFNSSDCNLEVSIIYDESICMVNHAEYMTNDMDEEYRYHDIYLSCIILQQLYKISSVIPSCEVWGRDKDYQVTIGYSMKKLKVDTIIKYLSFFEKIKIYNEEIDENFISHKYPELFSVYLELYGEKFELYNKLMLREWSYNSRFKNIIEFKNMHDNYFKEQDRVFTNIQGNMIIGFSRESFQKVCSLYALEKQLIDDIYFGVKYCMSGVREKTIIWDVLLVKDALHIIEYLTLGYKLPIYYFNSRELLIVKCLDLWICIKGFASNNMNRVIEEKNTLQMLYKNILEYIPIEYKNVDYDFSQLSTQRFENLCRDLLLAKGFINVICRGKTNAPDKGVDIEADEEYDTLLGHKSRHWIFQCKHMIKQVDRRDICEIPFLLKEFSAQGYGMFYTNTFTPNTIDRFKTIREGELYICDINEINSLLNSYSYVSQKYFGLT